MAVIKHIASKNADYGESERYLIFQHNEYTQKPILDDEGHMILRDEYYLDVIHLPLHLNARNQTATTIKIKISMRSSLIITLSALTPKTERNMDLLVNGHNSLD